MENKVNMGDVLTRRPAVRFALGICVVVAGADTGLNGLTLGCVILAILLCGNLILSILRKLIPAEGHFAAAIIAYCAITACAQMVMDKCFAAQSYALGVFLPLCAVSGVLSGEIEASCKRGIGVSLWMAIRNGFAIAFVLTFVGCLRELLGIGTLFGKQIMCACYEPVLMALYPAGGFVLAGVVLGLIFAIFKCGKGETK